jgi:hypothetical protein
MVMENMMKHSGVKVENLANYVCIDEDGNPLEQGMGKVLEISLARASLETHVPIESSNILLTIAGMKNESKMIDIKGRVIYCREIEPRTFQTGIQLLDTSARIKQIVVNMIRVFNRQNETDG